MTVKELIEELKRFPEDMEAYCRDDNPYGSVRQISCSLVKMRIMRKDECGNWDLRYNSSSAETKEGLVIG